MKQTKAASSIAILLGGAMMLAGTQLTAAHASQSQPGNQRPDERLTCAPASLHGAFGFTATGSVNGLGSVVRTGREVFEGRGHASGTATTSAGGSILRSTFTATHAINPDCTGTVTEVDSMLGTVHDDIVVVDAGRGIRAIGVDPGATIGGHWEKQSRD